MRRGRKQIGEAAGTSPNRQLVASCAGVLEPFFSLTLQSLAKSRTV